MIADLLERAASLSLLFWGTLGALLLIGVVGAVVLFLARWGELHDDERGRR